MKMYNTNRAPPGFLWLHNNNVNGYVVSENENLMARFLWEAANVAEC